METTTSKDGTTLAFDRLGSGPPVVLVCGGSVDRMADAAIAQELASDLTVFNYDRRGSARRPFRANVLARRRLDPPGDRPRLAAPAPR
jgi:hypothetical protein